MIVLTPSPPLWVRRRVLSSLIDAAFGVVPFAFVYFTRHPTFMSGWLQIGLPFALFAPVRFFALTAFYPPPTVSWDREGLHVRLPHEVKAIPWSEFARYRFTWSLPRRLKIYRTSGRDPVTIDLSVFDDQQRDALMTEIAMRVPALPHTRSKVTTRVGSGGAA